MSAFGFWEKDAVVDAIETLAQKEKDNGKTTIEIVESILEATSYGVKHILYKELEAQQQLQPDNTASPVAG